MNVWQTSWVYKLWVIGGMGAIVAFAVIGGMSDPGNQDFVLILIPVIAVYVAGIFFLQWRGLRRELRERPGRLGPAAGLVRWNIIFGAVLCVAIFIGVYLFYEDGGQVKTLYPLGDSGPGIPIVLLPAVVLVIFGVLRTLHVVRELGRSGASGDPGPTDFEGPTDIEAPAKPTKSADT